MDVKFFKNYAKENNLNIVSFGYDHDWCDQNLGNIGPLQALKLMKDANHIATSMFHGLLLSVNLGKKAFVIASEKRAKKMQNLLTDTETPTIDGRMYKLTGNELSALYFQRQNSLEFLKNALHN